MTRSHSRILSGTWLGVCRVVVAAAVMSPVWLQSLAAQRLLTRTLGPLEVEYNEPFSEIRGIRELRDGRVVVLDYRDQTIHLINLGSRTGTIIGRQGDGPGEYRLPERLVPLPGDSTAVVDMTKPTTMLVVTPEGATASMIPVQVGPFRLPPVVADRLGRLYQLSTPVRAPGVPASSDSAAVVGWDRTSSASDTVAMFSLRTVSPIRRRSRPGLGVPPPFATRDSWTVDPHGRVAVVAPDPYRVTYFTPDGARKEGPPVPVERVALTAADRRAWIEETRRPVAMMTVRSGVASTGFAPPPFVGEPSEWPRYLPAFLRDAAWFAPDGALWVVRATRSGTNPMVDVFDGEGRRTMRVTLPRGTKLVGFGRNSVYLVRVDEDDLQYLQRYPMPGER